MWFVEEMRDKNSRSEKSTKNEVLFNSLFTKKKSEKKIETTLIEDAIFVDSDEEGVVEDGSEVCLF